MGFEGGVVVEVGVGVLATGFEGGGIVEMGVGVLALGFGEGGVVAVKTSVLAMGSEAEIVGVVRLGKKTGLAEAGA